MKWPAQRSATRPLADLLPYLLCGRIGDLEPVHLLDDGALGFAVQFEPPPVDTEPEAEARLSAMIDQALRALPAGLQWQWFARSSTQVEDPLQRYLQQPGVDPVGRACASETLQRWRHAQQAGFFPADPALNFFPRSQAILLAIKSQPMGLAPWQMLQGMSNRADLAARTAGFVSAARALQATLQSSGIEAETVDADAMANLVADLLFPYRRLQRGPVSTGLDSIRDAVASLGRIEPVGPGGFATHCAGQVAHHRVASMLWHPHAVRPGLLNELARLRPILSVCLSGSVLPPAAATVRLKAQGLLNARSAHRFNEIETQARAQAIEEVERRLFAEGERLIEGRLQVHVVESSAEEAESAALAACDLLRDADIEAAPEPDIGASLILRGCLPFTLYEQTERKLRRRRRFLSRDFADLHPAAGCWTGAAQSARADGAGPAPVVMYSNAAGSPLFIDPSKAERNPHALVVGQSGSGKSFFVHDYLLQLWRLPDVRLFLVSIKPDYRKLALLLGRYVQVDLDCGESLNPFCGAPTPENQTRWVAALSLMLTEGQAGRALSREQEICLQDASLAAAARNWDATARCALGQTLLEDICFELERRPGPVGRDLAFQLLPYRRGPYRALFNAPRTLGPADRFVFFNLGSILRQPCSAAACFCVFSLVDEVMLDPALRAVPKGLVADEAWALVQNPHAAAILERSLKAYRSLGGFALPIVQDPRDLDTPAGRVMLVNTATKIILPMDASGHDEIRRFVRLNDREFEIVRNLRLVKRRYSEFFASIEALQSGKGLLIPDPLRYAISTTDPADEARLEALYREHGDMLQAVRAFAASFPYGIASPPAPAAIRGAASVRSLAALAVTGILALALTYVMGTRPPSAPSMPAPLAFGSRAEPEALAAALSAKPDATEATEATARAMQLLSPERTPQVRPSRSAPPPQNGNLLPGRAIAQPPAPPLRNAGSPQRASSGSPSPAAAIPDRIERGTGDDSGSDPLAGVPLQAELIEAPASRAPLTLIGLRAEGDVPMARLRSTQDADPAEAWFETGDTVAAGWTVVAVDERSATLLSALGERVRLTTRPWAPD